MVSDPKAKLVGILLALCLALFFVVPLYALAQPSAVIVDPRLTRVTQGGNQADMLVVMRSQSNIRALRLPAGAARKSQVLDLLRQTAEASQTQLRAQLDAMGARYHSYWIANLVAVRGGSTVLNMLASRSDVLGVESDEPFRALLETPEGASREATGIEWNLQQLQAPALWNMGINGSGIVYANADTGVQWDHPALQSKYRGWNGAAAVHDYSWWDAVHEDVALAGSNECNPKGFVALPESGSTAPCDDYGHGTHTMGIGVGDDGAGNQVGVAPGAKWIACRNMENGVGRPSMYIECMQFFLAPTDLKGNNPDPTKSPDVVGNSYGCPPGEGCAPTSLQLATESMRAAGIFMAVSAGNMGPGCGTINDPPALDEASITVGATDSADNLAFFSSRGPVTVDLSYRRKPDLAAPGVGIRSTYPGSAYVYMSGTSMAAPHVAGAVALLWSGLPSLRGDVDNTELVLEMGSRHLTSSQGCGGDSSLQVPNNAYGFGRINVLSAYFQSVSLTAPYKYMFPLVGKSY